MSPFDAFNFVRRSHVFSGGLVGDGGGRGTMRDRQEGEGKEKKSMLS